MKKLDRPQITLFVILIVGVIAAVVLRGVSDPLRSQIWSGVLVGSFIVVGWSILSNRRK